MRILMVTPYAPERDGIAVYAMQSVARLRAEGNDVEVLSPRPSAAHHHLDLQRVRGILELARRARRYDRVIVQFHPDVFFPIGASPSHRTRLTAALAMMFRAAPSLEVRVHETDYRLGQGWSPLALATRAMWHSALRIAVHTEAERRDLHRSFGVPLPRIQVAAHGADFLQRTTANREEARESLGIPQGDLMFLSIGFIQHHKGFDRAVRAFASLGRMAGRGARLDIVGSVRMEDPGQLAYVDSLASLVQQTRGAHLHVGYVNDEVFDRWIVAADFVVLPYHYIWSSGVLERAALYDRPVIATRVGGLADQSRPGTVLVESDSQLAAVMKQLAAERGLSWAAADERKAWPDEAAVERATLQEEVRRRAALERGGAGAGVERERSGSVSQASAPLRRLGAMALPPPASSRIGVSSVKRAVQRLTAWEVVPIVQRLNTLQQAVVETVDRLAAQEAESQNPHAPEEEAQPPA